SRGAVGGGVHGCQMRQRARGEFFFSSRRRHTRLVSDWSSDVCSSDLHNWRIGEPHETQSREALLSSNCDGIEQVRHPIARKSFEIGRASCRERVKISLVAVSLETKKLRDKSWPSSMRLSRASRRCGEL